MQVDEKGKASKATAVMLVLEIYYVSRGLVTQVPTMLL